jgi:hypothetical protein
MRRPSWSVLLATIAMACGAYACSGDSLSKVDGGGSGDGGPGSDGFVLGVDSAIPADSGTTFSDASMIGPDAAPGVDAQPFCNVLAATSSAAKGAAVTGLIEIDDYDYYDTLSAKRARNRVTAINFMTRDLPPDPLSEPVLFTGLPMDQCIATNIANPTMPLGPTRNIGTNLYLKSGAQTVVTFNRGVDMTTHMIAYDPATQADTLRLFDAMSGVPLARTWTWSTQGDSAAMISPATTTVGPVVNFEVTPAITATSAPTPVSMSGMSVQWTTTATAPGLMSIVLARAVNQDGSPCTSGMCWGGRYLICHATDDGEFTLTAGDLAAFGPRPMLDFDFVVSRSAVGPFCNEGVVAGAAIHTLIYQGLGIAR